MYLKPPPGDSRCATPTNPQNCFIPVQTEDDVTTRLTSAATAARANGGIGAVYGANYDPSRLGHGSECAGPSTNVGFECPNLEDGQARAHLDAIASDIPVFVTSEAGHVTFANTRALTALNICGTDVSNPSTCKTPTTNPLQEEALAQVGQLDEDLAFTSAGFFESEILQQNPGGVTNDIIRGVNLYSQCGYTLNQEGAAGDFEVQLYLGAVKADPQFPLTAAMLMYDAGSADFNDTVALAQKAQALINGNPDIFIAALKSFADGSTQEYTAFLAEAYFNLFPPFMWNIFPQTYMGLPDLSESDMAARAVLAHQSGYPLVIHQNGDQAISNSVAALRQAQQSFPAPNFRDLVLHAPLIDAANLVIVKSLNDPISFLMNNVYYWGLPLCQQVLGPQLATKSFALYPAADAENAGLRVTLHSDTPVSPPDPLFEIWVAKTRRPQQPAWYPNFNPGQCPPTLNPEESISIRHGIEAFTTNAAWQYGLENQLGMVKNGFTADLVFLSADPLAMENNPDGLILIRILGTVHHGIFTANPHASEPPIWPG
ncbi:MAG: amidohydrolase family protein [Candidatus Binataceae bacterium]